MTLHPEEKPIGCDVDDIICQLETLTNMKALQRSMGTDSFKSRFPNFEQIEAQLVTEISVDQDSLKEAIERCGHLRVDDIPGAANVLGEAVDYAAEAELD